MSINKYFIKHTAPIFFPVMLTLLAMACHDGSKVARHDANDNDADDSLASVVGSDLPRGAEVLFDDFFFNFATNEQLQRSRILFPLTVERETGFDEQIADSVWQSDRFFFDRGEYTMIISSPEQLSIVTDTTVCTAMVEKFFLTADSVSQYFFFKREGRWTLDYMRIGSVSRHPDASFLRFYQRFSTDSLFRQRSLAQEIAFTGQDPEDDFAEMEGFITPDSWDAFAPVLPQDTIYNIVYGDTPLNNTSQRIFIIRGIDDEQDIELTFSKERGNWYLTELTE